MEKKITKQRIKGAVYRAVCPLTAHSYADEGWAGVNSVITAIREALGKLSSELQLVVSVVDGGYRTSRDGMSRWKEFCLGVKNADGKTLVGGQLNAHAAGSMADPFDRYDMSVVLW